MEKMKREKIVYGVFGILLAVLSLTAAWKLWFGLQGLHFWAFLFVWSMFAGQNLSSSAERKGLLDPEDGE